MQEKIFMTVMKYQKELRIALFFIIRHNVMVKISTYTKFPYEPCPKRSI